MRHAASFVLLLTIIAAPVAALTLDTSGAWAEPPPEAQRTALRFGASGGFGVAVSPALVAPVVNVDGGMQWQFSQEWRMLITAGLLWSPRTSAFHRAPVSMAEVDVGTTLVAGVLAPCLHGRTDAMWLFGCLGFQAGAMWADSATSSRSVSTMPWAAFDPRLGIEVPLPNFPRVAARLFGDLLVPIHRPNARVGVGPSTDAETTENVWRVPRVGGAVSLGFTFIAL